MDLNFHTQSIVSVLGCRDIDLNLQHVCAVSAKGDQKRALYPLGLELQIIVNCHGGAGNRT